jgi:hypothetical protein
MVMLFRRVSGQLAWSCAITAMRSRRPGRSMPSTGVWSQRTVPDSGWYRPASTLARVVFPEPFSPTSATTSPWLIRMLTSRSAGSSAPG